DADDIGAVLDDAHQRVGLDVDRRPPGDVVDDDGDVHRVRYGAEVAVETLPGRLFLVRVYHHDPPRAGLLGVRGEVDRLGGGVRARARDDVEPAGGGLDHDFHHALVLVVAERRRLARGAARDNAIRAPGYVHVDELPERGLVHLAAAKR